MREMVWLLSLWMQVSVKWQGFLACVGSLKMASVDAWF